MDGEPWSDERLELLRSLWEAGETAASIALRLGNVSRSAVLGKIHRLRLHSANARKAQRGALVSGESTPARRRRSPARKKPVSVAPAKITPRKPKQNKSLLELANNTCRWPFGRPGSEKFHFCGAPEADLERGIPYCPHHMQRAYQQPSVTTVRETTP